MKFGIRIPSIKKKIAARTSVKRVLRHNLGLKAPRGMGWLTNPKKAAYNRVYNRTTKGCGSLFVLAFVFILLASILMGCGKQTTGDDVVASFKAAGLEAEKPTAMTKDDYKVAPYVCKGTHFFIPSIGETAGGRIFICDNSEDRDLISNYYTELGKASALFFSWVFVKDNIVVQINGDLPEEKARQYEAAIP
jgi:hypothetical protein